jgi:hypothetical protein
MDQQKKLDFALSPIAPYTHIVSARGPRQWNDKK